MPVLQKKPAGARSAAALLLVTLCLAYAGDAGHGFIKDDFRWIRETRVGSLADAARLFERTDGFYRPLVSLSFAFNSATAGLEPRAYGLTNFAFLAANAALVWLLARRLGLDEAPALVAAGVWAFNFHGINMAVLWISGRTALLVTAFALLAALATAAGRSWLAGVFCLGAMLSKEEAVLLPILVALWSVYDGGIRQAVRRSWPCFVALAVYLLLRTRTDAYWPTEAPSYYRFTFAPSALLANVLEYADRALTWPAVIALGLWWASGRRARFDPITKRLVVFGAMWLACTFALTVFVPVRSSLYAVLPSVGSALAAGAVAAAALRAEPRRTAKVMVAMTLLPLLLLPLYWRRNERWVRLADVSAGVVTQVRATAEGAGDRPIALVDAPSERFNLDAAFGGLWPDAAALTLPPGTRATLGGATADAIVLRLVDGRLVRER